MSIELYLVFVLAIALLIATPGPNVALIVGTSLTHGAPTGLIAMAGVNLGVMVQLVVVAAGLSWIVEVFAKNFDMIRFVGAAYLLFLGDSPDIVLHPSDAAAGRSGGCLSGTAHHRPQIDRYLIPLA